MATATSTRPGYEAPDIAEDIQGAIWDRIQAFTDASPRYTGVIGAVDCKVSGSKLPPVMYATDAYGKRWRVTVEAEG